MTYEEQLQYEKLTPKNQKVYDEIKEDKPSWGHKQIMFKVAMLEKIDTIPEGPGDPDPDDPKVMKSVLEGAKDFLNSVGIVFGTVITIIDQTLETLGDIIYRGISSIGNALQKIWDWIF